MLTYLPPNKFLPALPGRDMSYPDHGWVPQQFREVYATLEPGLDPLPEDARMVFMGEQVIDGRPVYTVFVEYWTGGAGATGTLTYNVVSGYSPDADAWTSSLSGARPELNMIDRARRAVDTVRPLEPRPPRRQRRNN